MIVIKVELHSAITKKVSLIGKAIICNDGSGSISSGNYNAKFWSKRPNIVWREGKVENFPRKSLNVWYLLSKCLTNILKRD